MDEVGGGYMCRGGAGGEEQEEQVGEDEVFHISSLLNWNDECRMMNDEWRKKQETRNKN
jgi:hypothetical protein